MSGSFDSAVAVLDRSEKQLGKQGQSFWRMEEPEIDVEAKTVTKGGMFAHQRHCWELPNFIKVLVGGYGSGKTYFGCKWSIAMALHNAPCPIAVVSPTFPLARETVVVTIAELLQGKRTLFGRAFWWRYNASTHQFRIKFHGREGRIIVYSGDDPMSLRGPNLAGAHIDEPFIQDHAVFKQMIARVRHPQAVKRGLLLTGTPEQLNWGYDLCVGEDRDRNDVGFVQASTRQNRALDDGYVKRLEGSLNETEAAAYIDGVFKNLSTGAVYHAFDMVANVRDIPMPDGAVLGCGMDFNVDPMAATIFWTYGKQMHFIEEIELPNADTEFMCSVLRERYGERLNTIYPDASGNARKTSAPEGRTDFWYIREAGYSIDAAHDNPKRRDRFNAANGKLKPKAGEVTLTISPRCKKLKKYLALYTYELMNKQKQMSHLLDAFCYPVNRLFPIIKNHTGMTRLSGA